jgi:hypothetical protein
VDFSQKQEQNTTRTSISTDSVSAIRKSFRRTLNHLDAVFIRTRGLTLPRESTAGGDLRSSTQSLVIEVENNPTAGYGFFLDSVKVDDVEIVADGGVRLANVGQMNYLVPIRGPRHQHGQSRKGTGARAEGPVCIIASGWPFPLVVDSDQLGDVSPTTSIVMNHSHPAPQQQHQYGASVLDPNDRASGFRASRVTPMPFSSNLGVAAPAGVSLPSSSNNRDSTASFSTLSIRQSLPPLVLPARTEAIAGSKRHTLSELARSSLPPYSSPASVPHHPSFSRQSIFPRAARPPVTTGYSSEPTVPHPEPASSATPPRPPLVTNTTHSPSPSSSVPSLRRHFSAPLAAAFSSSPNSRRPSPSLPLVPPHASPLSEGDQLPPLPPSKTAANGDEELARDEADENDDVDGHHRQSSVSASREVKAGRTLAVGVGGLGGQGGDALISLSLVPLRGPRISALDVFLVDVFILNRSMFVRYFAVGLPPTTSTKTRTAKAAMDMAAKENKENGTTTLSMVGLLALENDFRIG